MKPAVSILLISISILWPHALDAQPDKSLAQSQNSGNGYATVFLYHKFNEPKSPSTSIPTNLFKAQLSYLKENNYNVIGTPELISMIKAKKKIPAKTVVITIDDGYRSVYTEAFPLLKEYDYPFTIFLYMEAAGRYSDFMTIDEINEVKRYKKATFANHSYSHARFASNKSKVSSETYKEWIENDLLKSETRFYKILGFKPLYYGYPYGEYSRDYIEIVKKHGYLGAFTQDSGSAGSKTDPFMISRDAMVGSWASIKKFKDFLRTEPLYLEYIRPSYGILKHNPPEKFEIGLSDEERYKDIEIYISEFGWLKPVISPETKRLSILNIPKLRRKINRIGVKGVNKLTGRSATYFYMVILP